MEFVSIPVCLNTSLEVMVFVEFIFITYGDLPL